MKNFACVALLVVTIAVVFGEDTCPEHEVSVPCKSSCEPTCDKPSPAACKFLACEKGCACKPNLLRDVRTGSCVPPYRCSQECEEFEEWTPCGAACPQTCQNLDNPPYCPSDQACTPGCVCTAGYIYDLYSNKCVLKDQCPTEED